MVYKQTILMSELSREQLYAIAWMQHDAGLIDCALDTMNMIIDADPKLSHFEQQLFENLHKRRIAPLREFLSSDNMDVISTAEDRELLPRVRMDVLKKLISYMTDAIYKIDTELLPNAKDDRSTVFLQRLRADYFRYIAETEDKEENALEKARDGYTRALEHARAHLKANDSVFLGVIVNYTLFLENELGMVEEAFKLGQETVAAYDTLNETAGPIDQNEAGEQLELRNMLYERFCQSEANDDFLEEEELMD